MMIIRLLLATFPVVVLLGPHAGTLFLLAATAVWLLLWVVMPRKPEPVKDRRPGHGRGR